VLSLRNFLLLLWLLSVMVERREWNRKVPFEGANAMIETLLDDVKVVDLCL